MANNAPASGRVAQPTKGFPVGAPLGRSFFFKERFQNWGFDATARPNPWLMVPAGESKIVGLYDPTGLQVYTDRPDILEVRVAPFKADEALVVVKSPVGIPGKGKVMGAYGTPVLDVSVKTKLSVKVAFFYVNRGPSGTSRNPAHLHELIEAANSILEPQANVVIERVHVTAPFLPIPDLPKKVTFADWDRITNTTQSDAYFNVYFVGDYFGSTDDRPNKGMIRDTEAETMGNKCIFEDDVGGGQAAATLAHEVVHRMLGEENEAALGFREGHSLIAGELMFVGGESSGRKIPKAQVDLINPD